MLVCRKAPASGEVLKGIEADIQEGRGGVKSMI